VIENKHSTDVAFLLLLLRVFVSAITLIPTTQTQNRERFTFRVDAHTNARARFVLENCRPSYEHVPRPDCGFSSIQRRMSSCSHSHRPSCKGLCVANYCRPQKSGNGWEFSQQAIKLLQEYKQHHSWAGSTQIGPLYQLTTNTCVIFPPSEANFTCFRKDL